jgi:prolyl-tRNA synthetase
MKNQQTLTVRRDTGAKEPVPMADICTTVSNLLDTIQNDMFIRAKQTFDSCLKEVTRWEDMVPTLDAKCIAVIPWCELEACEDDIKDRSGRVLVFLQVVFKLGFDELL